MWASFADGNKDLVMWDDSQRPCELVERLFPLLYHLTLKLFVSASLGWAAFTC